MYIFNHLLLLVLLQKKKTNLTMNLSGHCTADFRSQFINGDCGNQKAQIRIQSESGAGGGHILSLCLL